jgi:hypothetical protein
MKTTQWAIASIGYLIFVCVLLFIPWENENFRIFKGVLVAIALFFPIHWPFVVWLEQRKELKHDSGKNANSEGEKMK